MSQNDIPPMTENEQWEMRVFLALNHEDGKCHIYGDDGELQCNNWQRHGRCLDFRRERIEDLLNIIRLTRMKEFGTIKGNLSPSEIEKEFQGVL